MTELAKRAVASKHWEWMPGMSCLKTFSDDERRVVAVNAPDPQGPGTPELEVWDGEDVDLFDASDLWLPDFNDPATLGCLLALVREAWFSDNVCVLRDYKTNPFETRWVVDVGDRVKQLPAGETEAEALVAALEAAS